MKRAKQPAKPRKKPEKPKRDELGRWMKGHTGNRNGRPHKFSRVDQGDVHRFKNSAIEVPMPDGRRIMMTREAAIQHRLYQSAIKGNVHAQIFLARRFESANNARAKIAAELDAMIERIKKSDRKPTEDELGLMLAVSRHLRGEPLPGEPTHVVRVGRKRRRSAALKGGGAGSDPATK